VAAQGIVESLEKVYKAKALLSELGAKTPAKKPTSPPSS
jgi:hypothetical protein